MARWPTPPPLTLVARAARSSGPNRRASPEERAAAAAEAGPPPRTPGTEAGRYTVGSVPEPVRPRYTRRQDVPRDLRTADELSARGYRDLGAARASLALNGTELALYSTSEARRRRDGMWRRSSGGEEPGAGQPDVVTALAEGRAAKPGQVVSGPCRLCGQHALGLIDGVCPNCRRRRREAALSGAATAWIAQLLQEDFVVLDTETTGLGRRDEIIEVGVVDAGGTTVLQTLVWPRGGRVPAGATRVHGLTIDDLAGAPSWPQVLPELRAALRGRRVLAWNAPFDERMVRQSSRLWHVQHDLPAFECAMRAYALARGVGSGRSKLAAAAAEAGVLTVRQRHRSADDARLTLAVLTSFAGDGG